MIRGMKIGNDHLWDNLVPMKHPTQYTKHTSISTKIKSINIASKITTKP